MKKTTVILIITLLLFQSIPALSDDLITVKEKPEDLLKQQIRFKLYPHNTNETLVTKYYNLIQNYTNTTTRKQNISPIAEENNKNGKQKLSTSTKILMDSPWPTLAHDTNHTGRSPYRTNRTPPLTKWRFNGESFFEDSPTIGENGTIYAGNWDGFLYAINPNGTQKWRKYLSDMVWGSSPTIADDGTIYIGSWNCKLNAIAPNGTLIWRTDVDGFIASTPAIGSDGTIYISHMNYDVVAVNPNGTIKWKYPTGYHITCSPVVGMDGTIYIGSGDTYFYALNPNGTLKWRYNTGDCIKGSASIAPDGTIYVGSWDGYLYALYQNGTLRWRCKVGGGTETNPAIAEDGTIYVGGNNLYAVNPNGIIKWVFYLGSNREIFFSCPAISKEGIVYFGTMIGVGNGGELIAVNPDGTERWRNKISNHWVESSPSIAEDGTVYIGSSDHIYLNPSSYILGGRIHAFDKGEYEVNIYGPYYSFINTHIQFNGSARNGTEPYTYLWDFGDGNTSQEICPVHSYTTPGNYTVLFTVNDSDDNCSTDQSFAWIQDGNIPPNIPSVEGPTVGHIQNKYEFNFSFSDPEGAPLQYLVDWGDGINTGWIGPCQSGSEITLFHTWKVKGTYTVMVKAKDPYGDESDWGAWNITVRAVNIDVKTRL